MTLKLPTTGTGKRPGAQHRTVEIPCPPGKCTGSAHWCGGKGFVRVRITSFLCPTCAKPGSVLLPAACPASTFRGHGPECPLCKGTGLTSCPDCEGSGIGFLVFIERAQNKVLSQSGLSYKGLGVLTLGGIGYGCSVGCGGAYCYMGPVQVGSDPDDPKAATLAAYLSRYLVKEELIPRPLRFGEYSSDVGGVVERVQSEVARYAPAEVYCSTLDPNDPSVVKHIVKVMDAVLGAKHRLTLTSKLHPPKAVRDAIRTLLEKNPGYASLLRMGPSVGNDLSSSSLLERRAAAGQHRFKLADFAREIGAGVIVNVAPLHPGLTDDAESIYRILDRATRGGPADVYVEALNPKGKLGFDGVIRAYGHAFVHETDPAERAKLWAALHKAWTVAVTDPRGLDYTYKAFKLVQSVVAALGSQAAGKVWFWPDAKGFMGLKGDARAEEMRACEWALLPYEAYARARSEPAQLERFVPRLRTALEAGVMQFRREVIEIMRTEPMTKGDVNELIRLTVKLGAKPRAPKTEDSEIVDDAGSEIATVGDTDVVGKAGVTQKTKQPPLSEAQKQEIRRLVRTGLSCARVAETLGGHVTMRRVSAIKAHVTRKQQRATAT